MQTSSRPAFNTIQLIVAILAIVALHTLASWQWALIVPLAYSYFLPGRAKAESTLQMLVAWLVMLTVSYSLATPETALMTETVINIIAGNRAQGLGWLMPIVSLLFAALLGLLAGVVGSGLRFMLRNPHKYETGVV